MYLAAARDGEELLVRRVEFGVLLRKGDGVTWWSGEDGRRRLRGNMFCKYGKGEVGTESASEVTRGVRSSSEFSEMVSPISSCPP